MKRSTGTTPRSVRRVRGEAKVWFYANPDSVDIYVRPATDGLTSGAPASIWFRIPLRQLVKPARKVR